MEKGSEGAKMKKNPQLKLLDRSEKNSQKILTRSKYSEITKYMQYIEKGIGKI